MTTHHRQTRYLIASLAAHTQLTGTALAFWASGRVIRVDGQLMVSLEQIVRVGQMITAERVGAPEGETLDVWRVV